MSGFPDDFDDEDFDDDIDVDPADYPTVVAAVRFIKALPHQPWFAAVGEPFNAAVEDTGRAYAEGLGFLDCDLAAVVSWEEALEFADPAANAEAWEAEEQLHAALLEEASAQAGPEQVAAALAHAERVARPALIDAARAAAAGQASEDAIITALAAGLTASHAGTLVVLAAADAEHPLALKYRLFELGRWPVSLAGSTLHIF